MTGNMQMNEHPEISSADVACAVETFNRWPNLSAAARRVGIELLSFVNRRTRRCDPSEGLIARRLGLKDRTVRKAKSELRRAGLVSWSSHGGHHATSAYDFSWPIMRAFAAESGQTNQLQKVRSGTSVPVQQERQFQETY